MRLIELLEERSQRDESLFQRQLAKEDLARFERLSALFDAAAGVDAFVKDAAFIGWTPDDLRTHELLETLEPFLRAYFTLRGSSGDADAEAAMDAAWTAFARERMAKLVHCL